MHIYNTSSNDKVLQITSQTNDTKHLHRHALLKRINIRQKSFFKNMSN